MRFTRITVNPEQMGEAPCLRGLRIPVATLVGLVADRMPVDEALKFAAEAVRERQLPLVAE